MKEVVIEFSIDELIELSKQLLLARNFLINHGCDNRKAVNELITRICATGFGEAPETNAFRHGGLGEPAFMPSLEIDIDLDPIVQ